VGQMLQQQLVPFYSDIKLSITPKSQARYHKALQIINTTSFGDHGKGIPSVQRDLHVLAQELAEQYGQGQEEVRALTQMGGGGVGKCPLSEKVRGPRLEVPALGDHPSIGLHFRRCNML